VTQGQTIMGISYSLTFVAGRRKSVQKEHCYRGQPETFDPELFWFLNSISRRRYVEAYEPPVLNFCIANFSLCCL